MMPQLSATSKARKAVMDHERYLRQKDRRRARMREYMRGYVKRKQLDPAWVLRRRQIAKNQAKQFHQQRIDSPQGWLTRALARLQYRVKKSGILFDLTSADLVVGKDCPVFGTPFTFGRRCRSSPSFDRIDPHKGYVKGNVIVVSLLANTMKQNVGWQEILRLAEFYRAVEQSRGL